VHVARGRVHVNDVALATGDAAMITDASTVALDRGESAEILLFDLP
jgi:redox-sensitive bicupin YhaK (pirin superfamily)